MTLERTATWGDLRHLTGLSTATLTEYLAASKLRPLVHGGRCPECDRAAASTADPEGLCTACRRRVGPDHRGTCLACVDPLLRELDSAAAKLGVTRAEATERFRTGRLKLNVHPRHYAATTD